MVKFDSNRRFGIELEVLAFDGKSRPDGGQPPAGINEVAALVYDAAGREEEVNIRGYEHTDGNSAFIVKPDSSCGIEVCTPILKGWNGLEKTCRVVDGFRKSEKIKVDDRCSVHIHVEIADLEIQQLASVVAQWIKCEPIFMDMVPQKRKQNRYCPPIGCRNIIDTDEVLGPNDLIKRVGQSKYLSFNMNQYIKNGRKTVEVRTGEGEGCKDPFFVKNWVKLMLHFVECTKDIGMPKPYNANDPFSSYCWLDPKDFMKVLKFDDGNNLSNGLKQLRNWFLARTSKYMSDNWIRNTYARKELNEIINKIQEKEKIKIDQEYLTPSDMEKAVFSEEFRD